MIWHYVGFVLCLVMCIHPGLVVISQSVGYCLQTFDLFFVTFYNVCLIMFIHPGLVFLSRSEDSGQQTCDLFFRFADMQMGL